MNESDVHGRLSQIEEPVSEDLPKGLDEQRRAVEFRRHDKFTQ